MDQEVSSSESLNWQSADRSRTVRIDHAVIRGLHVEVMRGFGVTRRRGTEAGGILLGQNVDGALVIDGFVVVPCEYAFGPSYVLDDADTERFAEALAEAGARAIGYFRSHTREGFSLDSSDCELWDKFFAKRDGRLALLLKPFATRPPEACLYFTDTDGHLRHGERGPEFSFSTRVTNVIAEPPAAPAPAARPDAEPESVATAASAAAPVRALTASHERVLAGVLGPRSSSLPALFEDRSQPTQAASEHQSRKTRDFATVALAFVFTAAVLSAGFVAGFQLAGGHVSVLPPALSTPDPAEAYDLQLHAQFAGSRVRVHWSAGSVAARLATAGTLYVQDGIQTNMIPLTANEIREGSILHLPQENTVRFRLELNLPGGRLVSESVDWRR